jgi:hypothetical protein
MRIGKIRNKKTPMTPPEDEGITNDVPVEGVTGPESIEDFIELKRLQNRILEKLIDKIKSPENTEK